MADRHLFPSDLAPTHSGGEILVIGLGRFGSSLARTLVDMGYEVLGVDSEEETLADHAEALTHVVALDCTNEKALRQLGVADIHTAVVCIGTDVESSVLTTAALNDLGVKNIWAKAMTEAHGKILGRVGAHHVVFPEADMGQRVAHLVSGRMLEYVELDENFVLIETPVPARYVGMDLASAGIRGRHNVTVVCIKPHGQAFTYATPETVLGAKDLIVVSGFREDVEGFANS